MLSGSDTEETVEECINRIGDELEVSLMSGEVREQSLANGGENE